MPLNRRRKTRRKRGGEQWAKPCKKFTVNWCSKGRSDMPACIKKGGIAGMGGHSRVYDGCINYFYDKYGFDENENLVDEATITYDLENIITDGKKLNIKSYSFKE